MPNRTTNAPSSGYWLSISWAYLRPNFSSVNQRVSGSSPEGGALV